MSPDFLLTSLIVVLIPGTGVIYTVSTGLLEGERASIAAAFGCTLGIVPHLLVSVAGLAALVHASSIAFEGVRIVGVLYLLWLAWGLWHAPDTLPVSTEQDADAGSGRQERSATTIVMRGMLINLLNPKLSVFFVAFLPQFVPASEGSAVPHMTVLGLVFMAMTFVVFIGYGIAAGHLARRVLSSSATMRRVHRAFSIAFAGFALKLALLDR